MPSWLPSIPYPPPDQAGYWDPVTATLTWCEEVALTLLIGDSALNTDTGKEILCDILLGRDRQHVDQSTVPVSCIQRHQKLQKVWPRFRLRRRLFWVLSCWHW
jgi:hypothetical protein